jgi:proteasome lid subunit RPN8/RPN11
LESAYPSEGCGLVVEAADGELEAQPCPNIADVLHAQDSALFPRTSRTSYAIDPMVLLEAEERGDEVRVIYHSHCDVGHSFSDEDARLATRARDVVYLVASVVGGLVVSAGAYRYDAASGRYEEA